MLKMFKSPSYLVCEARDEEGQLIGYISRESIRVKLDLDTGEETRVTRYFYSPSYGVPLKKWAEPVWVDREPTEDEELDYKAVLKDARCGFETPKEALKALERIIVKS